MDLPAKKMLKAALLMGMAIWSMSAAHAEIQCRQPAHIPVTIRPVFDEPRFDYTAGIRDIQRMVTDERHSIHEQLTLGVTRYESTLEFRTPVETLTYPNGPSCATVQSADVVIGYNDVTVYIAREIPKGSCGFDEIVAHERKHINVNRDILNEYEPRIRERLALFLEENGNLSGRSRDAALAELKVKFQAILDQLGNEMMRENVDRQRLIDTDAEYERLSRSCQGQLAEIVGYALGHRR